MPGARIRTKLGIALLIPLLSLAALVVFEIRSTSQETEAVQVQTELAQNAIGPTGLVTSVQSERIWAALEMVGLEGTITVDAEGYEETRAQTDDALEQFRARVSDMPEQARDAFEPAVDQLSAIQDIRHDIDTSERPTDLTNLEFGGEIFDRYNALVEPLLDAASRVGDVIDDHELRVGLSLADAVARQLNTAAAVMQETGVTILLTSGGVDSLEEVRHITGLSNDLRRQTEQMDAATGPYADLTSRDLAVELSRTIEDQVRLAVATNEIDPTALVEAVGTPGPEQPFYAYQDDLYHLINERAAELEAAAQDRFRALVLVAGVTLVGATALVVMVARSLTRPLRSLREQASVVAGEELPGTVHEVLATPAGVDLALPEVRPVRVRTKDEVAAVADALNGVQRSALELAVGQTVLRRNVGDALVNLGRRNQNLGERQLDLISELEAHEADPDVLGSLFHLDHIATRMRRNAECLVVLGQLDTPRRWSKPVSALNVIRSAIGEVEEFRRVVVNGADPVSVAGAAAADVTHLLAELIENALTFSPGGQAVELVGRLRHDGLGYTVTVEDSGLGMPPGELSHANRRLAGEESYTVAPSSYLGHYVTGQLARRHGLGVRLVNTLGGGLTAVVDLPNDVLVDRPGSGPTRPPETVPAATAGAPAGAGRGWWNGGD